MGEVDLRLGDVAVDRDHGLCVFEGLEQVATQGEEPSEALRLRFAGDAILMVPVSQADRIWRYGPEPDAVTLDKLDGGTWARRRLEAEATMARTARLMLEAARARRETGSPGPGAAGAGDGAVRRRLRLRPDPRPGRRGGRR